MSKGGGGLRHQFAKSLAGSLAHKDEARLRKINIGSINVNNFANGAASIANVEKSGTAKTNQQYSGIKVENV